MDISIQEQNVIAIESQLEKLCVLADKIEKANGMSKSFAMEAIDVLPNFGDNMSTAYYSKEPSIIRHTEALEEISGGIWALIIAATAAVIAIVYKFVKWLFGSDSDAKPSSDKVDKAEHSAKLSVEQLNEIDKLILSGNYKKPGMESISLEDMSHGGIDEIINNYIKDNGNESTLAKTLRIEDPLLHDVLYRGDYTKTIKSTNQVVSVLPVAVDNAAKTYLKTVDTVFNHIKDLGNSREDNNPVNITLSPIGIDMFSNGKRISILEGANKLELMRKDAISASVKGTMLSYTKLNNLYSLAIGSSDIGNILKKIESTKKHMDDILASLSKSNVELDKMKEHVATSPVSVKYSEALRMAFRTTRVDVMSCFKFFHELLQYASVIQRINTKIVGIQKVAMSVIEKEIKLNHKNIHGEFKVIQKKYNDALSLDFT